MKTGSSSDRNWHPDINTALVWAPHAQRTRRDDVLHYLKVLGLTLMLAGSGFGAVLLVHHLTAG